MGIFMSGDRDRFDHLVLVSILTISCINLFKHD